MPGEAPSQSLAVQTHLGDSPLEAGTGTLLERGSSGDGDGCGCPRNFPALPIRTLQLSREPVSSSEGVPGTSTGGPTGQAALSPQQRWPLSGTEGGSTGGADGASPVLVKAWQLGASRRGSPSHLSSAAAERAPLSSWLHMSPLPASQSAECLVLPSRPLPQFPGEVKPLPGAIPGL